MADPASAERRLDGLAVLVTGASSGIGEAIARRFALAGAKVALVARREERLAAIVEDLRAAGATAVSIPADLADQAEVARAVEEAAAALGGLDVVVNNAGVMLLGSIESSPPEEWSRMIDLNFLGLTHCARASLPHLLAAAAGARGVADLVNVSSVAGRKSIVGSGVYSASKHAVGAFSESLRQELADRQVRVSLVEPGVVETELGGHTRPEARAEMPNPFEGVTRLRPDDIAELVEFMVTRPARVALNEVLVRPTDQAF